MEGGFNNLPISFFNSDANGHKIFRGDSSVMIKKSVCLNCNKNLEHCDCLDPLVIQEDPENPTSFKFVGELASIPYESMTNLIAFVDKFYPDYTNFSCGLHFHAKPKTLLIYKALMTKKFCKDYLDVMEFWARSRNVNPESEIWKRLKGKPTQKGRSNYCKLQFKPYRDNTDPDRYHAVNYCYNKHKTIEFRILPCFQSKNLAKDALKFTFDFINCWLISNHVKSYDNKELLSQVEI